MLVQFATNPVMGKQFLLPTINAIHICVSAEEQIIETKHILCYRNILTGG